MLRYEAAPICQVFGLWYMLSRKTRTLCSLAEDALLAFRIWKAATGGFQGLHEDNVIFLLFAERRLFPKRMSWMTGEKADWRMIGTSSAAAKGPSTPEWQLGNSAPITNPHVWDWAPARFFPGMSKFIGVARIFSGAVHFFPSKRWRPFLVVALKTQAKTT